jgi:hypothetical protein
VTSTVRESLARSPFSEYSGHSSHRRPDRPHRQRWLGRVLSPVRPFLSHTHRTLDSARLPPHFGWRLILLPTTLGRHHRSTIFPGPFPVRGETAARPLTAIDLLPQCAAIPSCCRAPQLQTSLGAYPPSPGPPFAASTKKSQSSSVRPCTKRISAPVSLLPHRPTSRLSITSPGCCGRRFTHLSDWITPSDKQPARGGSNIVRRPMSNVGQSNRHPTVTAPSRLPPNPAAIPRHGRPLPPLRSPTARVDRSP